MIQTEIEFQTHRLDAHLYHPYDQAEINILLINGHHHDEGITYMVSKCKEFTCCVSVKCTQ